ncbi:M23 family metallopeptidase [Tissierella sp. Yu-01]|uniref:M23 family metallopeptidase n=1 Tax=Tissierella sp. Yu-01 TaxID=3035694 RepID=UPI00240E37D0|nr:M23 family metallopeptidase [Tissierella sp. Yu-01]WFA08692.1 M23 family metallopeptidase [Tissierella sp. Yu-01]
MKNKLKTFIKQNGFLLFLFICVCVVAAGTIFVSTQDFREARNDRDEDLVILEEVSSIDQAEINDETSDEDVITEEEIVEKPINEVANEDELSNEDELAEETMNKEIEFIDDYEEEEDDTDFVTDNHVASYLPVEGEIVTEFSDDKLIYSSTLDEWRHHAGIDIKAALGTKVKAPLSGTIKEVREDELWGIVIVIDHGDGLESRFSNLGTSEMVKPGISVQAGDYISTVGDTAKIEMKIEPHLHYEVTKNGKNIDPRSITN